MNNGLETRYFLSALTGAGYYALHRQFLRPPERYFCILPHFSTITQNAFRNQGVLQEFSKKNRYWGSPFWTDPRPAHF